MRLLVLNLSDEMRMVSLPLKRLALNCVLTLHLASLRS